MTTEILDAEITEIVEDPPMDRSLIPAPPPQTHLIVGAAALAALSDEDFERNLLALKSGIARVARIQRELMDKDTDYGVIPGTPKPTLLKPGAEKLALAYGLMAQVDATTTFGDGITAPPISVQVKCRLHLGSLDGVVVAEGLGQANSWETRYRYRKAEVLCPECGTAGLVKGRPDGKLRGQWWCANGCKVTFAPNDERILPGGKIDNPDPFDLGNTLLKMAEKRSFVDGVLRATGTSGLFTQDLDDEPPPPPQDRPQAPQDRPGAAAPSAPASSSAPQEPEGMMGSQERPAPRPQAQAPVAQDGDICQKHRRPWKATRYGWKCTAQDDRGENGYCSNRPTQAWVAAHER